MQEYYLGSTDCSIYCYIKSFTIILYILIEKPKRVLFSFLFKAYRDDFSCLADSEARVPKA